MEWLEVSDLELDLHKKPLSKPISPNPFLCSVDHGLVLMFTDVKASVLLYVLDTTVCLILVTQLTLKWIDHFRVSCDCFFFRE